MQKRWIQGDGDGVICQVLLLVTGTIGILIQIGPLQGHFLLTTALGSSHNEKRTWCCEMAYT